MTNETLDFAYPGETDGILGMSFASLSDNVPTYLDQVISQHHIENVFGICMGDEDGILTIGGIEPQYYVGSMFFSPLIPNANNQMYNIKFLGLTLYGEMGKNDTVYEVLAPTNNSQLIIANTSSLIDSGTNSIILNTPVYRALIAQINSWCKDNAEADLFCAVTARNLINNTCVTDFDMADIEMLPNITFYFAINATSYFAATLEPYDYVVYKLKDSNVQCASFGIQGQTLNETIMGSGAILGDPFMHGFFTIFDKTNMQLGFAQKNVEMCGTQLSPPEEHSSSGSSGLKSWQIALIVVGGVILGLLLLGIVGGIIYYVMKSRNQYQYTKINTTGD